MSASSCNIDDDLLSDASTAYCAGTLRARIFAHRRRGYTLVELFLTLIVLMIVLGMMINLSNRVRDESAQRSTQQILAQLDKLVDQYQKKNGRLPPVTPVTIQGLRPTEITLQAAARANNTDLVRYLDLPTLAKHNKQSDNPLFRNLRSGPIPRLDDAWGSPIVFMPHQDPAIGMDPRGDNPFLFSAGPDRQYLTHADNVYSYDEVANAEVRSQNAE